MIRKYSADVILRFKPVADTPNDTGNSNTSTTTTTGDNNNDNNNNNDATTPTSTITNASFAEQNEKRHIFTSINYQRATAELAEQVRVREQERV